MNPPLALYTEWLRELGAGRPPARASIRFRDGSQRTLRLERWATAADAADVNALARLRGPVLDVGCGPGRHLHALARRGVFGLGVDLCPAAVQLARGGGANAIVGSIFDDVPHLGRWRSALLLDGNIGIGGRPERLLARLRQCLEPGGTVLAELTAPGAATGETRARIETPYSASDWFAWAEVSASSIAAVADRSRFAADDVWHRDGRWFAQLTAR